MKASLPKRIPYWHVDAFATKAFSGNQAAVMVLEKWLPDQVLQAIAAENMFAETAFLVANASTREGGLRWFTPEVEVALWACHLGQYSHPPIAGSTSETALSLDAKSWFA